MLRLPHHQAQLSNLTLFVGKKDIFIWLAEECGSATAAISVPTNA